MLKRVQLSSRRRVEFHTRNKSRDGERVVVSATLNGRDAVAVSQRETTLFTTLDRKIAA